MTGLVPLSCSPLNNVDSSSSMGGRTSDSVIAFVGLFGVSEMTQSMSSFVGLFGVSEMTQSMSSFVGLFGVSEMTQSMSSSKI